MGPQEHTLSKKMKHKKVPQRGMGVAQLEKIILEDRQLKDVGPIRRPLPQPYPPNSHPLISKFNPNQNQNRYLIVMPGNQGGFRYESNPSMWSCSSSMNVHIEPPSNQSFCQPDRDKMVGLMKRSYPFSMENIPIPSFNSNIPYAYVPPISELDESTSCGGIKRENASGLGSIRDQKTRVLIDENLDLAKDFLTLAPPQSSPPLHAKMNGKLPPLSVRESTLRSYQGQTRDASETEWSNQQPLRSFFPAAKTHGTSNSEVGEHVDLSLKL